MPQQQQPQPQHGNNNSPAAAAGAAAATTPAARQLMTRAQVIAALKQEIEASSLTKVSQRYQLSTSQVSDIVRGKANLSKRVLDHLKIVLHEFFERVG